MIQEQLFVGILRMFLILADGAEKFLIINNLLILVVAVEFMFSMAQSLIAILVV